MSFASGDATPLDSVTAMNVRTGEIVTFLANETLTLKDVTGIELIKNKLDVLVYPNPNSGQSTIAVNIPETQDIVISVRNQLGQLLCQSMESVQAGNQAFSLSLQAVGIYSVTVQHSKGLESFQVVSTRNASISNEISHIGLSPVTRHSSFKSGAESNTLDFIMGDRIRYTCYGSIHTTIFQDMPREVKNYNYTVNFYPCIDPDGMSYPIVEIGEQVWMASNLAYLPEVDPLSVLSETEAHYYVYGYDGSSISEAKATDNCQDYGVLYNLKAAETACPTGWHLSTDDEWKQLESFLGMNETDLDVSGNVSRNSGNVGEKLKSKSGWDGDGNGDDSEGFKILPYGYFYQSEFYGLGNNPAYWTSTESTATSAMARGIRAEEIGVLRAESNNAIGYSVRCLRDETSGNQPPTAVFTVTPESGPNTTTFTFDASGSTDDNTAQEDLEVRWDFEYEYDNEWDTQYSTEKIATFQYYYQETYTIKMEVSDSEGLTSIATRTLIVDNSGEMTDERDGKTYKTIVIGTQIWMAENLAWLPTVTNTSEGSKTDPFYYVYDYEGSSISEAKETENYNTYGVLYNWEAATTACPSGWHLSSDEEWKTLEIYLGMSLSETEMIEAIRNDGEVGKKLKSDEYWKDAGGGTNNVGFSAIPAGLIFNNVSQQLGERASLWTSDYADEQAIYRSFHYLFQGVWRGNGLLEAGSSVRCVKDSVNNNEPPTAVFTISPKSGTNYIRYTLDASACTDDNTPVEDLEIRWNFDYEDDPEWDTEFSSEKIMELTFPSFHKTYLI